MENLINIYINNNIIMLDNIEKILEISSMKIINYSYVNFIDSIRKKNINAKY